MKPEVPMNRTIRSTGAAEPATTTYDGGFDAMVTLWQRRRKAITYGPGEAMPPLETDLAALAATKISEPALVAHATRPSGYAAKRADILPSLAGKSELALLNALLIANLRKRRWPAHAPALFQRIWAEQGAALLAELDPRWLISSAITFSDHGINEAQRRTGQALAVLFSLMKLYEYERLHTGTPPHHAFGNDKRIVVPLPMGMEPFSLITGGLDINLLAPIWEGARRDKVIAPLALHLLQALDTDPGTLFRRLKLMRQDRLALKERKRLRRAKAATAPNNLAGENG